MNIKKLSVILAVCLLAVLPMVAAGDWAISQNDWQISGQDFTTETPTPTIEPTATPTPTENPNATSTPTPFVTSTPTFFATETPLPTIEPTIQPAISETSPTPEPEADSNTTAYVIIGLVISIIAVFAVVVVLTARREN